MTITQAAIAKLGTSSKQCAYCHGKKKSERTPYGDKVAKFLLEKEYVTKDEEKPNESNQMSGRIHNISIYSIFIVDKVYT